VLQGVAMIVGALNSRKLPVSDSSPHTPCAENRDAQLVSNAPLSAHGVCGLLSARCWLALAIAVATFHVCDRALSRMAPQPPRSHRIADFDAWRSACDWVVHSGRIPPDARFITPRLAQTFKWYTDRSDVATWKDVPQNAAAIVKWWDRVQDIYATHPVPASLEGRDVPEPAELSDEPPPRWYEPLTERDAESLKRLGAKYQADYVIAEQTDSPLNLEVVFENRSYVIYRLR
jgi:hypothetical protein